MRVPAILFLMSLSMAAYSVYYVGPVLSDSLLLSLVSCAAALLLIIWKGLIARPKRWIILDGSNILYWQDKAPSFKGVQMVVDFVKRKGYEPIVWFDANAGHLVQDRFLGPRELASQLGVSRKQVFVAPKGTPADLLLLNDARSKKVPVISNDKFRDWEKDFPQLKNDGFLLSTKSRDGNIVLEL